MWLKRTLIMVIVASILCAFQSAPSQAQAAAHDWTVAIYMSGDNSLSENVQQDLNEILDASPGGDIRVVALVDRDGLGDSRMLVLEDGDWVESATSVVNSSWGSELDMGASATLRDFASWAFSTYPSEHRALDLWGHGAGWAGVCMDRDRSWLTMPEVAGALDGLDIDLLSIDACQMGMAEVAYELRDSADVLVASEKDVPAEGWHYGTWLNKMRDAGNATEAGVALAQTYMSWALNQSAYSATVSVVDLGTMEGVADAILPFADEMRRSTYLLRSNITSARMTTEKYDGDAEYDLVHFAQNVASKSGSPRLVRLADVVEAAVRESVVYNDAWTRVGDEPAEHANGLSVWFPSNGALPQYRELAFAADTEWECFLDAYSIYSIPPAYSTSLSVQGTDADGDGAVDGIVAAIDTDAPGNVVFEYACEGVVTEMEIALTSGYATAAFEDAPVGEYEVTAYIYDSLGRLMALAVSPEAINVEAWLYVNGTVTDGSGSPVEGALVEVGWGGGWRVNGTTNSEGEYSIGLLYPTQFSGGTLTAIAEGSTVSANADWPGELDLDLVVEEGAEPFSLLPLIGFIAVGIYCAILVMAWRRSR